MTQYLIFSDLDGTLTNEHWEVSDTTKITIRNIIDAGHIFYICTGRMIKSVQNVAQDIDPRIRVVGSNGGVLQIDNDFILKRIEPKTLKTIYTKSMETGIPVYFFGLDVIAYTHHLPDYFAADRDAQNRASSGLKTTYHLLDDESVDSVLHNNEIANALFIAQEDEMDALNEIRAQLAQESTLAITSSHSNNIEVLPLHTSKGIALEEIAQHHNIDLTHTLAFGDGNNDIEMLKKAHVAVAMGNATDQLKAVATDITKANSEDGFAYFITNFLKGDIHD